MTDGPGTPPPPPPASSNLISRVMGIITKPAAEWRVIDAESTTLPRLLTTYVLILAAILPVAFLIGGLITGRGSGIGTIILIAVVYYAFEVGLTVALGFAIDALAPSFGGTKNSVQAFKLAAYASTPLYLLGIIFIFFMQVLTGFQWIWVLGGLAWGAYLLFLGLPILMRVSQDKAPAYAGASIGAWVALWVVGQLIIGMIINNLLFNMVYSAAAAAAAARGYGY